MKGLYHHNRKSTNVRLYKQCFTGRLASAEPFLHQLRRIRWTRILNLSEVDGSSIHEVFQQRINQHFPAHYGPTRMLTLTLGGVREQFGAEEVMEMGGASQGILGV